MRIIDTEEKPIYLWLENIEDGAMEQAKDLANLPFCFHHVAVMPDAHQGYGMPIGGVFAAEEKVIPNAVGVDIGCGMCAVKTSLTAPIKREQLTKATSEIERTIPFGFNHHKTPQPWEGFQEAPEIPVILEELESARYQLGSLGGGNHFIEIQKDSEDRIWIMIHSGSRNFGLKIAKTYHDKAKKYVKDAELPLPSKDLACLEADSPEAKEYLTAMQYALDFARASRGRMMDQVQFVFTGTFPDITFKEVLDVHHNYAAREHHFGKEVFVHRKGATSAKKGEWGIIPGSQGTKSYIVRGLGNPDSFTSCSHGAGRKMGRKAARKALDLKTEITRLEKQGILHSIRAAKDLDEAAGAYKDIQEVMLQQQDLVEILTPLSPLAVMKG